MSRRGGGVVSSVIFKLTETVGVKVVGLVVNIVLARLLAPSLFGVVAVMTAAINIVQIFVQSGLNDALIQNEDTTDQDYSTIFYVSETIALLCFLLLYFTAPFLMSFFHMAGYTLHMRVMLLSLFFFALNTVQIAKFSRDMQFSRMFVCQMSATVISGGLGIAMALLHMGIWALVVYSLVSPALACLTYAIGMDWRPRAEFSPERARKLFGFGSKMMVAAALTSLFANLRTFIIGRIYTSEELGMYSRGDQFPNIIASTLDSGLSSVMLPVYSGRQDEKSSLVGMIRQTMRYGAFLNFPAMIGLCTVARPMVELIYTEKWLACVPFIQVLSLSNMSASILSPWLVSIKAIGRSDIYMKLEIVRRIMMIIVLLISLLFDSLIAIALGWLVSSLLDILVVFLVMRRILDYRFRWVAEDTFKTLLAAGVMGGCVWLIGLTGLTNMLKLLIQVAAGGGVYALLSAMLKNESMDFFKGIALNALSKLRR